MGTQPADVDPEQWCITVFTDHLILGADFQYIYTCDAMRCNARDVPSTHLPAVSDAFYFPLSRNPYVPYSLVK